MAENPADELKRDQALVIVGESYRRVPGVGFAAIIVNGRRFVATDDIVEIQAHGTEIRVPRMWFWQLFAPVSPEVVGVSLDNAPVSHGAEPDAGEATLHYYTSVSSFVAALFEAVIDAAHLHSEHNQLREQALQALRDLQALGLIEIPVLFSHQYRGTIDGYKWPDVVIEVPPHHAVRLRGMVRILARHEDIEGFDINDADRYLRRPVIFEVRTVHDERRAVSVRFIP